MLPQFCEPRGSQHVTQPPPTMQVSESLTTAVSLGMQPIAPTYPPAGATAGEADVSSVLEPPPPELRAICRRLRVSAHLEAAWAASGPRPALRFCLFFAFGITQCTLAVVVFGIPAPWSVTLLAVRVVPGWTYIVARTVVVAWTWFVGPASAPPLVTAADALTYSILGVTTCLQPRARMPFQSRLVFALLNAILVFCGCGALIMERPGAVRLEAGPALWALGVRTVRFVDAFTDLAFARLIIEDVRSAIPSIRNQLQFAATYRSRARAGCTLLCGHTRRQAASTLLLHSCSASRMTWPHDEAVILPAAARHTLPCVQMQLFGCFSNDSDPVITCKLHARLAISAIVLTLVDYSAPQCSQ